MKNSSKIKKAALTIQFIMLSLTILGQTTQTDISHLKIQQQTDHIFDSLVNLRRDLHRHPELTEQEERTSKKIAEYLKSLGVEVHTGIGGYGVVGILRTNKKGKRIAWRADIDALASNHPDAVSFPSENEGVRHICGHDVHTTIALGIANVLSRVKEDLSGTVYFIFQPAEENLKGAKAMIGDGLFDIINPEEIYALHIAPMPEGIVTTKANNLYADYRQIEIAFKNKTNKDALIDYIKELLLNLQNVALGGEFWDNRNLLDPNVGLGNPNTIFKDYITVSPNIEIIESDKEFFVKAYLSSEKHNQLDSILSEIKSTIKQSEFAGEFIKIEFHRETALVMNDENLTSLTMSALDRVYNNKQVLPLYGAIPDGRSDDFSFFQKKIPGVYYLLGASDFEKGIISMPHSPNFEVDENSIRTGVKYFSSLIIERLK
ncbi:M20 metallopeptidase family protein [Pontibacter harenae]|uniref:M20 metallopeptidase family protein n=1 Tax=Pontibacter harenae TaxID=2894083 RepID=UPI001E52BFB9|nr:M20 family metallopeptidase [Pontibacter harenae]MCC9167905.1 M20 family metallopeptidase [Pontibacter harenae]